MMTLNEVGGHAKEVPWILDTLGSGEKDMGLEEAVRALLEGEEEILEVNFRDCEKARSDGMSRGLLDRPKLTLTRVQATADGLLQVTALEGPVGEVLSMKFRSNGFQIGRKCVSLGAIGMIYEARPNMTADAFGLCFKSDNAVILEGRGDVPYSNMAITQYLRAELSSANLPEGSVQLIEDTSRDTTRELMHLNRYIDVLILRGGIGLIRIVMENSAIPVIETSTGSYHVYTDASANQNMALDTISNAKTQRTGVRSACESFLMYRNIAGEFLPLLRKKLEERQVEIRGDEDARAIGPSFVRAMEEDWGREYPDYILSLKLMDSVDEVIRHINICNTSHSGIVVTSDYFSAQRFLNEVDAAAVHVNTSTRFMGGEKFGSGTEIGISIQKFHARGPVGLKEPTTTKYVIHGNGRIHR